MHLLVECNFAVEMLAGESTKVFNLLRMIGVHLRHCRVQHCLASSGDIVISIRVVRSFGIAGER
jgi:hypothetical protein